MPDFLLTTCGTSLLTNGADDETRRFHNQIANLGERDLSPEQAARVAQQRALGRERLVDQDIAHAVRASAELNGLMTHYQRQPSLEQKRRDVHFLLASDTVIGRLTRDLAAEWMRAAGFEQVIPLDVSGLRTNALAEFRLGILELVEQLGDLTRRHRAQGFGIHFNLTGGFKSLNAVVQTLGALWADRTFFVFEGAQELLVVPRLPVVLDMEGTVRAHLGLVRALATCDSLPSDAAAPLPDSLVFDDDGRATLSPWALAAFVDLRPMLYAEAVHAPWHADVAFGPGFLASTKSLAPNRLRQVNERIDDLCRFASDGKALSRLDLKPIRAAAAGGSTHEADAWHDGSAMRLFLHQDGRRWIVDRLDQPLHR